MNTQLLPDIKHYLMRFLRNPTFISLEIFLQLYRPKVNNRAKNTAHTALSYILHILIFIQF